jgi:hypothetical protein
MTDIKSIDPNTLGPLVTCINARRALGLYIQPKMFVTIEKLQGLL